MSSKFLNERLVTTPRFSPGERDKPPSATAETAPAETTDANAPLQASAEDFVRIEERKIRDWTTNPDVWNEMQAAMDDYLYSIKGRYDIPLADGDIDVILDRVLDLAKQRDRL